MNPHSTSYEDLLLKKVRVAERHGIAIDPNLLHPSTKPHQRDIIIWALGLGRALVAPDCGMGKTHMAIETMRLLKESESIPSIKKCLIVTELGASETFINPDPEVGEGARLGVALEYVTNQDKAYQSKCDIVVTNYERVRNGEFDFSQFLAVWLDEGNYLKNMASETTNALQQQLKGVNYKFIATATPSPNETLELVNYAHVLGIADRGQILTQFFQRNSVKAGELTLHPQQEADFWLWAHSWMVAIESPSDLGYDDEGYHLPELEVNWIEVKLNKAIEAGAEKDGQKKMFVNTGNSLPDNARIKRESIEQRLEKVQQLISEAETGQHCIIWHHLETERKAIGGLFRTNNTYKYGEIFGAQSEQQREKMVVDFTKGDLEILATKPSLSSVGCNFQKHCNWAILMGINNDWDEFYQLLKRIHRPFSGFAKCRLDVIYTPEEYSIVQNLKRKWAEHNSQRTWLKGIVKQYGLNHDSLVQERRRTFLNDRVKYEGKNFTLINTDAVHEWSKMPENSVDLIVSSFPFGNHYEYTDKYNDFGHNATNKEFFQQMDYLIPNLLRALKPGRIAAIHLKNRIHYGSVTGKGMSIFHRFTHATCDAMEKHGFETLGFHYIPTDVVAENNQTYRLTFGELKKDSTKMGSGIPEEIWIFRKLPTSNANAYADEPVTKDENYTLANWQIDADAFWGSSGNRYLLPEELKQWDLSRIRKHWDRFNSETIYDYEKHVELLQALDDAGKLSRTFTTIPLRSNTDFIWNDVNRMQGMNSEQTRRKLQNHICPMPFDEVDRLIELYSNPGELVADPFGGLCTTGIRAIRKGRKAFLTELNATYAASGFVYLKEAEQKQEIPTLFDMIAA